MQAESSRPEIRLKGIAAAPGVGRGPVFLLQKGMPVVTCVKATEYLILKSVGLKKHFLRLDEKLLI
jgi:hypothetical protein